MSSWEQPLSGLTEAERRRMYARLDRERAHQLYQGEAEPGASYRRALDEAALSEGDRQ